MAHARAGAASIHDPARWRAEDRVFASEHAWAIVTGTTEEINGKNAADAVAELATELVSLSSPPTLDAMERAFVAMDAAAARWATSDGGSANDLWAAGLSAVAASIADGMLYIAHVGTSRAVRLSQSSAEDPLVAEALTLDHTLAELARRRSDGVSSALDANLRDVPMSLLGVGSIARMDFARIALTPASRIVLVSPGARLGLETPLGYLRELRSPAELAQRICVEGRSRAGDRSHHASAIVIDPAHASLAGPYR